MRGSKSVCLLCRLQSRTAVATAAGKTPSTPWQKQSQAWPFSTTSKKHDVAGTNVAQRAREPDDPAIAQSAATPPLPQAQKVAKEKHHVTQSLSKVHALFQQILQEQHHIQDQTAHPTLAAPNGPPGDLVIVSAIQKLEEMINSDTTPPAKAFTFFQREVHPLIQQEGVYIPQAYYRVKKFLMTKVIAAKRANIGDQALPTVADIFRAIDKDAGIHPKQWAELVEVLISYLVRLDVGAGTQTAADHERKLAVREATMTDLVESWKVLTSPGLEKGVKADMDVTDGFFFPRLNHSSLKKFVRTRDFSGAFSTLFPQYPRNQIGDRISMLAIATFTLMHDSHRCSVGIRQDASRFMSKVGYLINAVKISRLDLNKKLHTVYPRLEPYVTNLWPSIETYLARDYQATHDEPSAAHSRAFNVAHTDKQFKKFFLFDAKAVERRLRYADETRNAADLDRIWVELVGTKEPMEEQRAAQIRNNPGLIDQFIKICMANNLPDKAMMAWNMLGTIKVKPTIKTWNEMLNGLKRARNVDGIRNIWARLVTSGVQLDTQIWTTRISGLVEAGDVQGGLDALDEMVQLWSEGQAKANSKGKPNKAVQPTSAPVNAALAGLVRRNRHGDLEAAEKLLVWARKQGIEPDTYTFNTMLRPLIRDGERDREVEKLFRNMERQGVRADAATFAIVLDASFSRHTPTDPVEQSAQVSEVADSMVAAGLEFDMKMYAKMIYLLLKSNATTAARAVVDHLLAKNVEISPHIYTMLVEHCFVQRPPKLDVVDAIVHRRRPTKEKAVLGEDMDRRFYDSVIMGYTEFGRLDDALSVYKKAVKGTNISLSSVLSLVRELLRAQRTGDASFVVRDTKMRFEAQNHDQAEAERFFSHVLWKFVEKYGLLP